MVHTDRIERDAPGYGYDRAGWRQLPGYPGVWVSRWGKVWFAGLPWFPLRTPALRPQHKNAFGYLTVTIWSGHGTEHYLVHRLVMYAFVGRCPDGHEVDHINGDRTDNRLENLEYVTRQENTRRMWARRRAS